MDTVTETFTRFNTGVVIHLLYKRSQWFQVEPLPDDLYAITVKVENGDFLKTCNRVLA